LAIGQSSGGKMSEASKNLAINVATLRKVKKFSQKRLAELAGVPRSTLTHIESGSGNPSLANLVRLSRALGVGIEELLATPRDEIVLIPAAEVPSVRKGNGKVEVFELLPEKRQGMHIERMLLDPGGTMRGTPHVTGAKEYLHVVEGAVTMILAGESYRVVAGDVLAFPGDQPHSYMNRESGPTVAFSVVVPATVREPAA
jgi:transcriptional regulator with XRE-family HTH domain